MSKHKNPHVRDAREHVFALFRGAADHALEYHHFARTREIVDACKELAKASKLGDEARDVALVSAWFYDACYTAGSDDHARSLELCLQFLEQRGAQRPARDQVEACFRGLDGALPAGPLTNGPSAEDVTPADVLHDARLEVLARSDYVERIELLRFELQRRSGRTFSDPEWTEHCIAFFGANPYRTRYAQLAYGSGRAANLSRLQKQLRKQLLARDRKRADEESDTAKFIGKSAESLYYHFTRIQLGVMALADHRTSTMIHVNAIMISVVLALLGRRIHTERDLLVPASLMLLVNVVVVFLSVNSMRAAKEKLSAEEARVRDANLLSLFNENPMSISAYADAMTELVADAPQFQRRVLEHLYFTRRVLQERGNTLRLTYKVFLYGIAVAVVAFVVVLGRR